MPHEEPPRRMRSARLVGLVRSLHGRSPAGEHPGGGFRGRCSLHGGGQADRRYTCLTPAPTSSRGTCAARRIPQRWQRIGSMIYRRPVSSRISNTSTRSPPRPIGRYITLSFLSSLGSANFLAYD